MSVPEFLAYLDCHSRITRMLRRRQHHVAKQARIRAGRLIQSQKNVIE